MNKNNFADKVFSLLKKIMPEVAIILGGLLFDLLSKNLVQQYIAEGDGITLIPKLLNFKYVINRAAAFSFDFGLGKLIGDGGVRIFFIIITLIAVGLFGYLLFKKPRKGVLYRISFALIISGALGNLYDRIVFAYVRDFIQIEYLGLTIFGQKTFPIFNIADSCVVVGTILLIIFFLFFDPSLKNPQKQKVASKTGETDVPNEIKASESNSETKETQFAGTDEASCLKEADPKEKVIGKESVGSANGEEKD